MSSIDRVLVDRLATLSRLSFTDEQTQNLQDKLGSILDFVSQLQDADTDGVAPMTSVVEGQGTRERDDKVSEENRRDEYLALAPESEMGFFVVPRVVE